MRSLIVGIRAISDCGLNLESSIEMRYEDKSWITDSVLNHASRDSERSAL